MNKPLYLVIVGSSIFALAVESAMVDLDDVRVRLVDPTQMDLLAQEMQPPAYILLEKGVLHVRQMWRLMHQGHALIEIDPATTTCTTIYLREHSLVDGADIKQLLQHLADMNR